MPKVSKERRFPFTPFWQSEQELQEYTRKKWSWKRSRRVRWQPERNRMLERNCLGKKTGNCDNNSLNRVSVMRKNLQSYISRASNCKRGKLVYIKWYSMSKMQEESVPANISQLCWQMEIPKCIRHKSSHGLFCLWNGVECEAIAIICDILNMPQYAICHMLYASHLPGMNTHKQFIKLTKRLLKKSWPNILRAEGHEKTRKGSTVHSRSHPSIKEDWVRKKIGITTEGIWGEKVNGRNFIWYRKVQRCSPTPVL